MEPYLRPTATQRVRGFLASTGAAPPPWSRAEEVMDGLLALLHERRGDAATWTALGSLLEGLQGDAASGADHLPAPEAEVLSPRAIDDVVAELQAAIVGGGRPLGTGAMRRLLAAGRAPTLACLLMVGAVGCSKAPDEARPAATETARPDAASPAQTPASTASPAQMPASTASPAQTPASTASPAQTPASTASPAQTPASSASPDASLVKLFRDGSPEEVADKLENMIDAGAPGEERPGPPDAARRRPRPKPPGGGGMVLYKGITLD